MTPEQKRQRSCRSSLRLGFLYPSHAAEDDLPAFAARLDPRAEAIVVHTPVSEDAHRADALRYMGDPTRLVIAARGLVDQRVNAVVWACTSGSFVFGLEGARQQIAAIAEGTGVPASSTSLAFVNACRAVGAQRVSIAATYPDDIAVLFERFLGDAGIKTVGRTAAGIMTGAEVGSLGSGRIDEMLSNLLLDDAQAVLIPDTALHTARALLRLKRTLSVRVLTANQVTVWEAAALAGGDASRTALDRLAAAPDDAP